MNKSYRTWLMLALLAAGGCKTGKKAMESETSSADRLIHKGKEQAEFYGSVQQADLEFDWFAARGKAEITDGRRNYQVSLNLRMQQGEVIWASVPAILGLEVARVLITPDSIRFFNRLERTYLSQDMAYLQEHIHPGISFALLESALTGNSPSYLMGGAGELWKTPTGYRLEGVGKLVDYLLRFNGNYRVSEILIREKAGSGNFRVDYDQFENRDGNWIPRSVRFASTAEKENLKIHLSYDTFVLNEPQRFPFTIPERYKRIQ